MSDTLVLDTNHPHFPEVELTYGLLDTAAEVAYSWGYCHAMMRAISEEMNWLGLWGCYEPEDSSEPLHVAVERPTDGLLIDVDGAVDRYSKTLEGAGHVYECEWRSLGDGHVDNWIYYPNYSAALEFARALVVPVLERARDTAALSLVA